MRLHKSFFALLALLIIFSAFNTSYGQKDCRTLLTVTIVSSSSSNGEGFGIYVDGKFVGTTPSDGSLTTEVEAGVHEVKAIRQDGNTYYVGEVPSVRVRECAEKTVSVTPQMKKVKREDS
jgi:hypothetical protein